ncbi:MAG: hypothetical protein RR998_03740 [Oscillospiraceae bacterium]
MESEKNMFGKAVEKLKHGGKKNKFIAIMLVCGIAGILLIMMSELFAGTGDSKTQAVLTDEDAYNNRFVSELRDDLATSISNIDGAGATQVYITLERGVRYVYATSGKSTDDVSENKDDSFSRKSTSEQSLIIVDGGGGKAPVVLEREEPSVKGVVVICEGGDDPNIRQSVIELASTLCGVGTNRISVAKMQNQLS